MPEREPHEPPPSQEVASEDFLFHLYRGSELLQDNRVHDAKAELEQALSLQPRDPKGQDLLAIVYFRLGLYPRAIAIYERLVKNHPDAIEPRINLALSYLKTGQAAHARAELEQVVERSPNHGRAWGYLGLAYQRLGEYESARAAFETGGHDGMARRLLELGATGLPSVRPSASLRPASALPEDAPGSAPPPRPWRPTLSPSGRPPVATLPPRDFEPPPPEGFARLDADPGSSRIVEALGHGGSGTWAAFDAGAIPPPPAAPSFGPTGSPGSPSALSARSRTAGPPRAPMHPALDEAPASLPEPPTASRPLPIAALARELLAVFPRDGGVVLTGEGLVLVQAEGGFAVRLDVARSLSTAASAPVVSLPRRVRGRVSDEPLGGPGSPIVHFTGRCDLVLVAPAGRRLRPVEPGLVPLYLREDALSGFSPSLTYENGRLPVGEGDVVSMVQLRGEGVVVACLPERAITVEIEPNRTTTVRAQSVLGWLGHVVPRAVPPGEAPAGARGLVAFAGEGMVILDAR